MTGIVLSILLAAVLIGCSAAQPEPKQVQGVLLDVRSTSLTALEAARLRTDDGRELTFLPSPELESDPEFSPSHLRAHMARVDRVEVTYRETEGGLVALKIRDL